MQKYWRDSNVFLVILHYYFQGLSLSCRRMPVKTSVHLTNYYFEQNRRATHQVSNRLNKWPNLSRLLQKKKLKGNRLKTWKLSVGKFFPRSAPEPTGAWKWLKGPRKKGSMSNRTREEKRGETAIVSSRSLSQKCLQYMRISSHMV